MGTLHSETVSDGFFQIGRQYRQPDMERIEFYNIENLEISLSNLYNSLKLIQMQENQKHQPERFQHYVELPSKLGFTIKDTDHVFYYDKYGGWKDEYGNYYNEDGNPDEEPDSNSEKSVSQGSWDQFEDQFEKEFAPNAEVYEEFQKSAEILEAITENNLLLESHNKEKPLRVNFKIVGVIQNDDLPTEKQLIEACRKKANGLLNVYYDGPDPDTGYFVVENPHYASSLIALQGADFGGFEIQFEVESIQQLEDDPLNEQQLIDRFPKFVQVKQEEKVYIFHLQNHSGFDNKQHFKSWLKNLKSNLTKLDVIKMQVNEKNSKIPIVSMLVAEVPKLKQFPFDGKQIFVEPYVPRKKQQEASESKEEQSTQSKQVKVQETA